MRAPKHSNVKSLSKDFRNLSISSDDEIPSNPRRNSPRKNTTIKKRSNKRNRPSVSQTLITSFVRSETSANSPERVLRANVTVAPQKNESNQKSPGTHVKSLSKGLSQLLTPNKSQRAGLSIIEPTTQKPSKKRKYIRESSPSGSESETSCSDLSFGAEISFKDRNGHRAKQRKIIKSCRNLNKSFSDSSISDIENKPSTSRSTVIERPPSVERMDVGTQSTDESNMDVSMESIANELPPLSVTETGKENIIPMSVKSPTGKKFKNLISMNIKSQSPRLALKEISVNLTLESAQPLDKH